ncbi:MAG: patatin-like phospholipase family protein [Nitrospira sp.]|nr:patatin-like phospholipase family protein [Nitrospira sp.]
MRDTSRMINLGIILFALSISSSACAQFGTLNEAKTDSAHPDKSLLPTHVSKPPKHCLALSGGGMRAASYAIGVMKALSEFDQLDSLDIISGVSGGTYAMMLYYTSLYSQNGQSKSETGVSSKPLFTDGNLRTFVEGHTQLHYRKHDALNIASTTAAGMVFNAWNLPYFFPNNYISRRVGDPLLFEQDRILRSIYRNRLSEFYANYGDVSRIIPSLSELNTFVTRHHLPWPILNTTAYDSEDAKIFERKRMLEVTPLMLGSDSAGYAAVTTQLGAFRNQALDKSLIEYVMASGAALDVPLNKPLHFMRASIDLGLGLEIYAPTNSGGESKLLYLADGAFSENLGAYALAKRKCEVITIVDAEHDPWFHFEGYYALKKHMSEGLGMRLTVRDIDDHLKKVVLNPVVCPDGSIECDPPISTWQHPLMEGSILLPRKATDTAANDAAKLEVRYLKLSVDRTKQTTAPASVPDEQCAVGGAEKTPELYFSKHLVDQIYPVARDPQFPQIDTLNQWLLEDRVEALIDLGYAHMKAMICRNQMSLVK